MKTAIFVDIQNIYYTTRDTFKRSFNYKRFWHKIESEDNIILANAYAIDKGDEKQKKFQYALKTIGFTVKLKPYISRSDGSSKGDWDVGITIDILDSAEKAEKIILLSGNILSGIKLVSPKSNATFFDFGLLYISFGVPF